MLIPLLTVLSLAGQLNQERVAGDAAIAVSFRSPSPGETNVPVNASLLTVEQLAGAALVTFDAAAPGEVETNLEVETVEGITVVHVPEQAQNSDVTVRLRFQGGFSEDTTWTTGTRRIEPPGAAVEVTRAEVQQPLFESPHVEVDVEGDADLGAVALVRIDGVLRTRVSTQIPFNGSPFVSFVDFSYQGGAQDYEVVTLDRTGAAAEAVPLTVGAGGCAAAPVAPAAGLALALLLARRRRYTGRAWASSTAG